MSRYSGRFEWIADEKAIGWAHCDSGEPVRVGLYVDDIFITSDLADHPHKEEGECGFALSLPPQALDGQPHKVDVRYETLGVSINGTAFIVTPNGRPQPTPTEAVKPKLIHTAATATIKAPPKSPRTHQASQSTRHRIAYILSTREGGVPETNRDLMAALDKKYEPWVIVCDSTCIEVFRYHPAGDIRIEKAPLKDPISPLTLQSDAYDSIMRDVLSRYGFQTVHIRHMGWHAISLPSLCKQLGLPVLMSLHDYYTVCPSIKLLDDQRRHCAGICTEGKGTCEVELWQQNQFPPIKHAFINQWRARFDEAISYCDGFVTTSGAARSILEQAHPVLRSADFRLIEHGRDFAFETLSLPDWPTPEERLKILIPGGISPAKGADIINALIALNKEGHFEFHVLGNGWYINKNDPYVYDHGPYKRDSFAEHVKTIAPHMGVVFSIWAETYCHTLTEMWACGLPVLGLDIGAVGERISAHGCGWTLPVDSDPKDIYVRLRQIKTAPSLDFLRKQISHWQKTHVSHNTTAHMAAEYERFYQDIRPHTLDTKERAETI